MFKRWITNKSEKLNIKHNYLDLPPAVLISKRGRGNKLHKLFLNKLFYQQQEKPRIYALLNDRYNIKIVNTWGICKSNLRYCIEYIADFPFSKLMQFNFKFELNLCARDRCVFYYERINKSLFKYSSTAIKSCIN